METSGIISALIVALLLGAALAKTFGDISWFGQTHWSRKAVIVIAGGAIIGAVLDHLVVPFTQESSAQNRYVVLGIFAGPFVLLIGVPFLLSILGLCLVLPAWALEKAGHPSYFRFLRSTMERRGKAFERMAILAVVWLLILAGLSAAWAVYHFILWPAARWLLQLSSS